MGRGLDALLPGGGNAPDLDGLLRTEPQRELSITQIQPNPNQPRTFFDQSALDELAESIRTSGIVQPILVRPLSSTTYEIVAGERRFRAACAIGLLRVPVVIKPYNDQDALAIALIENLLREDLRPLEAATAYKSLMLQYGWTQETLSARIGKSRPAIANTLRLLTLPENVYNALESGQITEGHARALLGNKSSRDDENFRQKQTELLRRAQNGQITVRTLEHEMMDQEAKQRNVRAANHASDEIRTIEGLIRGAIGTRVRINGNLTKGTIVISYGSQDELTQLVDMMTDKTDPL